MASYIANDMRVGWVISHNGKRYSVTSITKVKPGKGGAFVQADLRDIDSGNKGGDRWRAEDKVEDKTDGEDRENDKEEDLAVLNEIEVELLFHFFAPPYSHGFLNALNLDRDLSIRREARTPMMKLRMIPISMV